MAKRILITGGSGLLGTTLVQTAAEGSEICVLYRSEMAIRDDRADWVQLDLKDREAATRLIGEFNPDEIIHCGSIGNVDYCDKNREDAFETNVTATQTVLDGGIKTGARVTFISSNAVYDGHSPFYSEDAEQKPVNYYGELKVEGEKRTLAASPKNIIVRPILMYGWNNEGRRGNLVTFWLDKLEKGEVITAVNDVWTKPLWVGDAADTIWAAIDQNASGSFNVCGADHMTIAGYAQAVCEVFGFDKEQLNEVPSSHFQEMTTRPQDTSFDTTRIETVLGIKPKTVREGLAVMRSQRDLA